MLNKLYKIFKNNLHLILPISFFVFILSAIVAGDVLAAGDIQANFQVPFGDVKTGSVTTIAQYVNAVYKYLVAAGGVLAGIMFAVGGFLYMTSAGDSGKAKDGKKYIINAILGLLLLVSSYVVLDTINPNATVLKDIVVKPVAGDRLKSTFACPCRNDSDCSSGLYCETSPAPYSYPVVARGAEALKNLAVGVAAVTAAVATFGMTIAIAPAGGMAFMSGVGSAAKGMYIAGKVALRVTWTVTKWTAKFAWKHKGLLLFLGVIHGVKERVKEFENMEMSFGRKCVELKKGEAKGVCTSVISKYSLKPSYLNDNDHECTTNALACDFSEKNCTQKGPACGPLTIYNEDGSLPTRRAYFASTPQVVEYIHPLTGVLTQAKFGSLESKVNGDLCNPANNKCPCIKWVEGKEFVECAQQARCVQVEFNNDTGGSIFEVLTKNRFLSICLTGGKGEACETNNDCRDGLSCADISDKDDGVKIQNSMLRKSIKNIQAGGIDPMGAYGELKDPLNRDKICIETDSSGNAVINATTGDACGSDTDCDSGNCVALVKETPPGKVITCLSSNVNDYISVGDIDTLCGRATGVLESIINGKICKIDNFKDKRYDCTASYTNFQESVKKKYSEFNAKCLQVVINRTTYNNAGANVNPVGVYYVSGSKVSSSGTNLGETQDPLTANKPRTIDACRQYYTEYLKSQTNKTALVNFVVKLFQDCFKQGKSFSEVDACRHFSYYSSNNNLSENQVVYNTILGNNTLSSDLGVAISNPIFMNKNNECYIKAPSLMWFWGQQSKETKVYINLSKFHYGLRNLEEGYLKYSDTSELSKGLIDYVRLETEDSNY